jgi:23S rRNA (uracil1939-C5)-methyltransferase
MKFSIEKAVYGGLGLARNEGKTVFVPLTLPGEQIEAHLVEEKRSFATAELDLVVQPSSFRIEPACPYFARCGGCQYQHAEYAGQLKIKQAVLTETLERAGIQTIPEIEVISADPWGYRNRIRLLVNPNSSLAYRGWKSHEAIAVESCPIAAPLLMRAAHVLSSLGLAEWANEVELFCNAEESALLLSIITKRRVREDQLQTVWKALQGQLPELQGVSVFTNSNGKDEDLRGPLLTAHGKTLLEYRAGEFSYQVSAGSFFQVNRFLVDRLLERVTTGKSGHLAWDLYAGVGLFARALANQFARVVAVESSPSSSHDLKHNLPAGHEQVHMTTLDFLRRHGRKGPKPELIVVDPPRAGLGKEVTKFLADVASRQMVYVSCDPPTLGRDLNALMRSGYRLRKLSMVDLFPQTFHMESVAELELG